MTIKKGPNKMNPRLMTLIVILTTILILTVAVSACSGSEPAAEQSEQSLGDTYTSEGLDASYEGALDPSLQLMLGTLEMEGTEQAVTPDQAATLLPLWQALQDGVTAEDEMNAVLKQIEGTMTAEQLATIAATQLTQEDLQAWMQEQGAGFPGQENAGARATRQAEGGAGAPGDAPGSGEIPPEMATRRAEMENMSDAEQEALRATMRAGGGGAAGGAGRPGGTGGQGGFGVLLRPLIGLLTERAG